MYAVLWISQRFVRHYQLGADRSLLYGMLLLFLSVDMLPVLLTTFCCFLLFTFAPVYPSNMIQINLGAMSICATPKFCGLNK